MEIDSNTKKNNIDKIKKIIKSKSKSIEIQNSVENFSINYAEENGTPFLLSDIYDTKINEIINTLENNENLVKNINDNKFNLSNIAKLRPHELNPDKYEQIIKKKEDEDYKKNNQATTDLYKCPKCKKRKTIVTEKQTRAGDEPATVFVECKECGYQWRF